jgi:hypothetical protein
MKRFGILFAFVLLLGGCASVHMQEAAPEASEATLSENQSVVVFFRDSILGAAIQAPVVEVTDAGVKFVGIVSSKAKVLYRTTPGKHSFVVGGESSHMLVANLAPKKFYYVRVDPRIGFFKARFGLEVMRGDEPALRKVLSECKWQKPGPSAQAWLLENKESMEEKCKAAAEDSDKESLNPSDGFDILIP